MKRNEVKRHNKALMYFKLWKYKPTKDCLDKKNNKNSLDFTSKYPQQENLYENDEYFKKIVSEWHAAILVSKMKRSNEHTIRKLHSAEDNQKQANRLQSIFDYANNQGLDEEKTKEWLFLRF